MSNKNKSWTNEPSYIPDLEFTTSTQDSFVAVQPKQLKSRGTILSVTYVWHILRWLQLLPESIQKIVFAGCPLHSLFSVWNCLLTRPPEKLCYNRLQFFLTVYDTDLIRQRSVLMIKNQREIKNLYFKMDSSIQKSISLET